MYVRFRSFSQYAVSSTKLIAILLPVAFQAANAPFPMREYLQGRGPARFKVQIRLRMRRRRVPVETEVNTNTNTSRYGRSALDW